jgi:hypothetical protein
VPAHPIDWNFPYFVIDVVQYYVRSSSTPPLGPLARGARPLISILALIFHNPHGVDYPEMSLDCLVSARRRSDILHGQRKANLRSVALLEAAGTAAQRHPRRQYPGKSHRVAYNCPRFVDVGVAWRFRCPTHVDHWGQHRLR